MKLMFSICAFVIGLGSSLQAQAANWQKIAVCENGAAVSPERVARSQVTLNVGAGCSTKLMSFKMNTF
jgi:hypothetical protein